MRKEYSFEKLTVWQVVRGFVSKVYTITQSFPSEERYGLIEQLRRASVSVSSNIAEGSSRKSAKEQAHFYQIAYASLMEVLNQIILSHDLSLIDDRAYCELRAAIDSISYQINQLRNIALARHTLGTKHPKR